MSYEAAYETRRLKTSVIISILGDTVRQKDNILQNIENSLRRSNLYAFRIKSLCRGGTSAEEGCHVGRMFEFLTNLQLEFACCLVEALVTNYAVDHRNFVRRCHTSSSYPLTSSLGLSSSSIL